MGQLIIDREWWNKLPNKEQLRVLELASQDSYISREQVEKVRNSMSKTYSNLHH